MAAGLILLWGWWFSAAVVVWVVWRAAEWLYLRPRRLERALRAQGLQGSRYRFPYGDLKGDAKLVREARRQPIPLSEDIVQRVVPNLQRRVELYGGKSKMPFGWFGPIPRLIIMDQEIIRDIVSNKFGHFEKPKISPIGKLLALGVASYEGEKWAKHRRIINTAFHVEKLKRMMPAFSICCDELISRWEDFAGSAGKCDLNVWPEFQRFTGDVISRTAFGNSYEEGQRIFELQLQQAELLIQTAQNLYIPGFRFIPTQKNRQRQEIHREVVALLRNMIEQRDQAIRNGEASTDDLLGILMESNLRHCQDQGEHSQGGGLTTDDVIEECKLFYLAGHETTSVLLTWTLVLLSIHPSWQEQAREEVLQVFGQNKPDFDGLSRLKILTMILYEVLRLYPPAAYMLRQTYKEIKLGGINIPPGVQMLLPIILIHHSKEFWGEDAVKFNPKRFADGVSKATKNQLIFFPFGWGPRICPGQSFALTEAKLGLARILQRFAFELSQSYTHAPYTIITLQPQYGAQLVLHKV